MYKVFIFSHTNYRNEVSTINMKYFRDVFTDDTNPSNPRFQKQINNVNHLVLETLRKKHNILLSEKELNKILETLYEFRVID